MRQFLAASLAWMTWSVAASAGAIVPLNYAPGQKVLIAIVDANGNGAQGPLGVNHGNIKAQCAVSNSGTEVTINEAGAGFVFTWMGGSAQVTFDPTLQGIGSSMGEVCYIWWEGSGAGAGSFALSKTAVQFVPVTVTGTVVSSADCTNSSTLFDSDLPSFYGGTNGPREAGILFVTGALKNELRRIGGYNTNGCVQINQAFSGVPAAGDKFIVVNE